MDSNEARSRLQDLPDQPRRHFTRLDIVLIIGAPLLAFVGGVMAAAGSVIGVIIVAVSSLMVVSVRAIRLSRTDEPVIARFTFPLSIFVAVVVFLTSYNLFTDGPYVSALFLTGLPLLGAALYVVFFVVLFWRRRR